MTRDERNKASLLETALARHTESEKRALTDLGRAGFRFRTIEEAYERLREQRSTARFTARQMEIASAVMDMKAGK